MKAIPLNGYEPTEIPEQYDPEVIFGADYVYYDKGGLILKDKAKISEIIQPDSDYTDNYFLLRDNYKNGKPLLNENISSIQSLIRYTKDITEAKIDKSKNAQKLKLK